MASLVSNLFYFFLACLLFVLVVISSFEVYYEKPGPSDREKLLIINKGQSVANIASHLIDLNLIENRMAFLLVVRFKGFHDKIKFGQYMIPRSASIKQITDELVAGVSVQHKIIVPEGLSTVAILDLLNTVKFLEIADIISGLIKASFFGLIIGVLGTFHGLNTAVGARGVGKATISAVVWSSISVLAANYILTEALFNK